jgi:hypothetical protein
MVDLTIDGSFTWTIDITAAQVLSSPKFVFKFTSSSNGYQFNPTDASFDSPGFLILPPSSSTFKAGVPSSILTATNAATPKPKPPTDTAPLSAPVPSPDVPSFSLAGQAAVAAGLVAVTVAAGGLAWAAARRYRRQHYRPPDWPAMKRLTLKTQLHELNVGASTLSPGDGDRSPSMISLASPMDAPTLRLPLGVGVHWYGRTEPVELEAESVRWG